MCNVLLKENLSSIISSKKAREDDMNELYEHPQELANITVENIINELHLDFGD